MLSSSSPRLTPRNSEFYLQRLKKCLAEAEETSLPQVRERCLRAAAAWQEMYEKASTFDRR
tara:strand:+ start:2205 stop:2387 length:183 start_codon:yes stop_codon:yes gene_type:complete